MSGRETLQHDELFAGAAGVPNLDASFDYVVLGGGTAGLALAARLSEDPKVTVAVVEAGGFYEVDNGVGSVIPALAPAQASSSSPDFKAPVIDWGFVTAPGKGLDGRRMHYARGKTLGGSSALNYMGHTRGTKGTYQAWADKVGDQGYTWDNLLPYFKKGTHLTPPDYSKRQPDGKVSFDATVFENSLGGPLQVSWPNWAIRGGRSIMNAMAKAGIPETDSFDNGNLIGSSWCATTINPANSIRSSSKSSYLESALEKAGIKVYTKTRVERIIFDGITSVGALVNTDGTAYELRARKEVILAAGTFQSPQILMVSGIGPKKVLSDFNIPIVSALDGVGKELQDHILFNISYQVSIETASRIMADPVYAQQVTSEFMTNGTGPLTSPFGPLAFEKLTGACHAALTPATQEAIAHLPADWPEIEYLCADAHVDNDDRIVTPDPMANKQYFTIMGGLMTNLSRGTITITSTSTADHPVIDLDYLTHPAEIEIAIATFKRIRQIWDQASDITVGEEFFPGRDRIRTDEDIHQYLKDNVAPIFHAAGTCAMAREGEKGGVVDSKCRVFGTKGLRVVDASVFPLLPPCHPQATIYALAEKIADDIKAGR